MLLFLLTLEHESNKFSTSMCIQIKNWCFMPKLWRSSHKNFSILFSCQMYSYANASYVVLALGSCIAVEVYMVHRGFNLLA